MAPRTADITQALGVKGVFRNKAAPGQSDQWMNRAAADNRSQDLRLN